MAKADVSPRLLTKNQAAAYCGLSPTVFIACCPVAPLVMQRRADGSSNKRLERFDVRRLDKWLDALDDPAAAAVSLSPTEWLARMD